MPKFLIENYLPFKTYRQVVPYVLQAVTDRDNISDGHTIESLACLITDEMHSSFSSSDTLLQKSYYEYQELHLAMEAFLDFYLAGVMTELESLTADQQRIRYQAAARCRIHCRNFLTTRKIE